MSQPLTSQKPGMSRLFAVLTMLLLALLAGVYCADLRWSAGPFVVPPVSDTERYPGGRATVSISPFASMEKVVPNLPESEKPHFYSGRALARQPWVKAPTITDARDGLGPIYNARGCLACHIKGGKSLLPTRPDAPLFGPLVRMSVVLDDASAMQTAAQSMDGVIPDPVYGDQLQTQSIALLHQLHKATPLEIAETGDVPPEAYAYLDWETSSYTYPDGHVVELRKPLLNLKHAAYGDFDPNTRFSLRNAPAIHGMGLLERIPQQALAALADPDDLNGDGISGRQNQVWDSRTQSFQPGRFGHKANRPNLDMIVGSAFATDIGISNPMFPNQPCSPQQALCNAQRNGNNRQGFELPDNLLRLVTNFNRNLGVPIRRDMDNSDVKAGRSLFYQAGCHQCHQPSFVTEDRVAGIDEPQSHLGGQTIWPYTDLLLHDMGPALADGRPDFAASGSEWRTPPLWGAGLLQQVNGAAAYLHDGRARTLEEAILWHGGEAAAAQGRFVNLPQQQRQQLLKFVGSL